jgi:hypothetical protein
MVDSSGVSRQAPLIPITVLNTVLKEIKVEVENGTFAIKKIDDEIVITFNSSTSLLGNYKLTITPQSISMWRCTSGQFSGEGVVTDSARFTDSPDDYKRLLSDSQRILKYNVLQSAGENAGKIRQLITALGTTPYSR